MDNILDLIGSISEGFPTYFFKINSNNGSKSEKQKKERKRKRVMKLTVILVLETGGSWVVHL